MEKKLAALSSWKIMHTNPEKMPLCKRFERPAEYLGRLIGERLPVYKARL